MGTTILELLTYLVSRTFCHYEVTYSNIMLSTLMPAYLIITTQFLVGSSMVDIFISFFYFLTF